MQMPLINDRKYKDKNINHLNMQIIDIILPEIYRFINKILIKTNPILKN